MCPERGEPDCSWAEDRFSAALEGELSGEESAAFEAHLEECPRCRGAFAEFGESVRELASYRPRPVPGAFLDAVREATRAGERAGRAPRARGRVLWLAWGVAAAAAAVAVYALATRPAPVEIRIPVEREVPVVREVPVERTVPVAVAVRGEGVELLRGGKVIVLPDGEAVELRPGDCLRAAPAAVDATDPFRIVVDTDPLAAELEAFRRGLAEARRRKAVLSAAGKLGAVAAATAERMGEVARRLAEAAARRDVTAPEDAGGAPARERAAPGVRLDRPPPVALRREETGALVLETGGPVSAVIPELISLLDEADPQVVAVARAGLEGIQERLTREHRIPGPSVEDPGGSPDAEAVGPLARLLGAREPPVEEPRLSEPWRRWWDRNREPIRLLAARGSE